MAAMARQQAAFMADFEDEEEASDAVETPAVRRVPSFPCIFAIRSRCFRCTPSRTVPCATGAWSGGVR